MHSEQIELKKAKFLEALKECKGLIYLACSAANVGRTTVFIWRKDDPDFDEAIKQVQEMVIDVVEHKLLSKIDDGDTDAIKFFLRSRGKDRGYGDDKNTNTNNAPQQIVIQLPTHLPPPKTEE